MNGVFGLGLRQAQTDMVVLIDYGLGCGWFEEVFDNSTTLSAGSAQTDMVVLIDYSILYQCPMG